MNSAGSVIIVINIRKLFKVVRSVFSATARSVSLFEKTTLNALNWRPKLRMINAIRDEHTE